MLSISVYHADLCDSQNFKVPSIVFANQYILTRVIIIIIIIKKIIIIIIIM